MIKPRRIGHATFETPDLEKAIAYYEKFIGLVVAEREKDRAFLASKIGQLVIQLETVALHHIAFELKDFIHLQNSCEVMGQRKMPIIWGPLRHGPGHNIATYHRNPDEQVVEFFCELDQMKDEELGYFEPRPWHPTRRSGVWTPGHTSIWGPPPTEDFHRTQM